MADDTTAAAPPQQRPAQEPAAEVPAAHERSPEERGSLEVRTKALTHVAEHAASEVTGTVRDGSTVRRTLGRDYPRATARLDGIHASVEIDVAVTWPAPVAEIADRTRDHVLSRSRELTGVDVRRVDVVVHVVTPSDTTTETTRRVE